VGGTGIMKLVEEHSVHEEVIRRVIVDEVL
jgi:hypothetical protein